MASPLLPATTSIRHAAILAGRSVKGFTDSLLGECATEDGKAVDTTKLERALGFELTPSLWLAADRRLDARRQQQSTQKRASP